MAYPNGWLIRMKQHFRSPSEHFSGQRAELEKIQKNQTLYASFGNFDRIEFVPILKFSDYRNNIVVDGNWYGKQQSVILYAIPGDEKKRLFQMSQDGTGSGLPLVESGSVEELHPLRCRFLVYSMLYISGEAKVSIGSYQRLLQIIRDKILDAMETYSNGKGASPERLNCEVFGTLNSAEIAILWAADQFTDVLFLLDQLRYLQLELPGDVDENGVPKPRRVCVATTTVISTNPDFSEEPGPSGSLPPVKGSALVQLACTGGDPGTSSDEAKDFIKTVIEDAVGGEAYTLYSCAGEYDYIAEVPFSALQRLFQQEDGGMGDSFSINCENALLYIRRTSTCLICRDSDTDNNTDWHEVMRISVTHEEANCGLDEFDLSQLDVMQYIGETGRTNSDYQEIKSMLSDLTVSSGMKETFELLYRDYIETLCMATDHLWVKDYNEQFLTVLKFMKSILLWMKGRRGDKSTASEISSFKEQFRDICDTMQQQASHIAESSKLFFEVPNSNVGYTAQFVLVYHAYYGIVKELIQWAYTVQRESWQHPLVPVINFANTPVIDSKMYHTADENKNNNRLISLEFPYDSWSNPLYYTPFLFHEIFHYAAPYSREKRNKSILLIVLHRICSFLIKETAFCFLMPIIRREWNTREKVRGSSTAKSDRETLIVECENRAFDVASLLEDMVYDALQGAQDTLISRLFGDTLSSDCTAYQLRNALAGLFGAPQKRWYREKAVDELCELLKMPLLGFRTELKAVENVKGRTDRNDCLRYINAVSKGRQSVIDKTILSEGLEAALSSMALKTIYYLREIYPDLAMIRGTSMGLIEYLAQFAMFQKNSLKNPSSVTDREGLSLRIGPIIESFLGESGKLGTKENKETFVHLFHVLLHHSENGKHTEKILEEDRELALEWFCFFEDIYTRYTRNYAIYRRELVLQIRLFYQYNPLSQGLQPLMELYRKYWELLRESTEEADLSDEMFQMNFCLIHMYQRQKSLKELQEKNENRMNPLPDAQTSGERLPYQNRAVPETEFVLYNADELPELLRKMIRKLQGYHEDIFEERCGPGGIWFRGVKDNTYDILPSLFAHYHNKVGFKRDGEGKGYLTKTPYELLRHRFEQFKFRADGAPEVYSQSSYLESDYLALMQHYQIQTNLLDWSEDIFASLYFALENFITNEKKETSRDAVIYLLDPAAYNMARRTIIKSGLEMSETPNPEIPDAFAQLRSSIAKSVEDTLDWVPNVSVGLNRGSFDLFFCADKTVKALTPAFLEQSPEIEEFPYCLHLPMAVYTSRLNPRIRAQSGQFMVFSPFTTPVVQDGKVDSNCFQYVSLNVIQKKWLEKHQGRFPFLLKLVIPDQVRPNLAQQLRSWGIKTANYYPELSNERFSFEN